MAEISLGLSEVVISLSESEKRSLYRHIIGQLKPGKMSEVKKRAIGSFLDSLAQSQQDTEPITLTVFKSLFKSDIHPILIDARLRIQFINGEGNTSFTTEGSMPHSLQRLQQHLMGRSSRL